MTGVAYIVLAHDRWEQTTRLAEAVLRSSPNARVLIALDGRTATGGTLSHDSRVETLLHERASDWGSWELVEATLDALRHVRDRYDPDLVVLVSGSDYPLRPLGEWEEEALAGGVWHGQAHPLEYTPHWGRTLGVGDDRLTRYAYRWVRAPWSRWADGAPRWWWRVQGAAALRLEPLFGVRVVARGRGLHYGIRRLPDPFDSAHPCFFGSQWFAASRGALATLLDEDFAPRGRLRRIYRRTVIPDESAFVTALAWRAPMSGLPPITHVRWDAAADQPVIWTIDDLPELVESGSPFCRKVDPVLSASLLDELDRRIA